MKDGDGIAWPERIDTHGIRPGDDPGIYRKDNVPYLPDRDIVIDLLDEDQDVDPGLSILLDFADIEKRILDEEFIAGLISCAITGDRQQSETSKNVTEHCITFQRAGGPGWLEYDILTIRMNVSNDFIYRSEIISVEGRLFKVERCTTVSILFRKYLFHSSAFIAHHDISPGSLDADMINFFNNKDVVLFNYRSHALASHGYGNAVFLPQTRNT